MSHTFLNHFVYQILERIGNFTSFYLGIAQILAAICFCIALGMSCVKVFLGASDFKSEFIRHFYNLVIYCVLLFIYPFAMKAIPKFALSLGYGAVFNEGVFEVNIDNEDFSSPGKETKSREGFYRWMNDSTGGIFTLDNTIVTDENGSQVKQALNFNIVEESSGLIDLNKTFRFALALLQIGFKSFPKLQLLNISIYSLAICFLYLFAVLVCFLCFILCLVQYVAALIDYFALLGFGILFVPLSLWEGTKSYTSALIGSSGKILIKLLVISAFLFLSVMSVIDILIVFYIRDPGINFEGSYFLELAGSIIFQSVIIFVLCQHTEKISGFLMGGNPQMSALEMAAGAAAAAGTGMVAGKMAMGGKNALADTYGGIASSIGAGALKGKESGSIGQGIKAGLQTMGSKAAQGISKSVKGMGQGLKNGGLGKAASMVQAVTGSNPNSLMNLANSMGSSSGGAHAGGEGGSSSGSQNSGGSDISTDPGVVTDPYGHGEKGSASDQVLDKANALSQSDNYLERGLGAALGFVGNMMNGNDYGMDVKNNFLNSAKQTAGGFYANEANRNGGYSIDGNQVTEKYDINDPGHEARRWNVTEKGGGMGSEIIKEIEKQNKELNGGGR